MNKNMNIILKQLKMLLDKELINLNNFLKILMVEKNALVDFNPVDIAECTKRKETLVLEQKILEESRICITRRFEEYISPSGSELTMKEILDILPADIRNPFEEMQIELKNIVEKVKNQNSINHKLTEHTLNCVQGYITAFRSNVKDKNKTYTRGGRMAKKGNNRIVYSKHL